MKNIKGEQLLRWAGLANEELRLTVAVFREKGIRRFARPLLLGLVVIFISRHFLYLAPEKRLQRVEAQLASAKATAQYAERYRDLDARLRAFYRNLPNPKNRNTWFLDTVREAMKAEGIYFTTLSPVNEKAQGGFVLVSMAIGCRTTYKQLASWIARMERSEQLLLVTNISVSKDPTEMGMNNVTLTVTTIMPKWGGSS